MDSRVQLVSIVGSAALLLVVLEMVRRRRLMERYSLIWLSAALVLLFLAIFRGLLEDLARAIGVASPPNALFLVAFAFITLVLLHFSVTISRLSDQTKVLAQKLAATEERLRRAERQNGSAAKVPGENSEPASGVNAE